MRILNFFLRSKLAIGIFFGILCFAETACKKFLTKRPDLRQEINSVESVSDLLTTAYPDAAYMAFAEFASDNVGIKEGLSASTTNVGGNQTYLFPYMFRDVLSSGNEEDQTDFYWAQAYQAIAASNKALQYIASLAPSEAESYQPYKGEALVCRAYAHFMLAVFFAPAYNPTTAANTVGIPYVEEVEDVAFKKYTRGNLASVFAKIERDLEEGIPLINDGVYKVPKFHFNKAAARAFATRFYLHKQDFPKVIQYANAVFGTDAALEQNIRPWLGIYKTYTYNDIRANYTKSSEKANLLLCSARSLYSRGMFAQAAGLNMPISLKLWAALGSMLDSSIVRSAALQIPIYGQVQTYNTPKYREYFRRTSINANFGQPYIMIPLFTTEEVLFNRAEAYVLQQDTVNALKDLSLWTKHRYQQGRGSTAEPLEAKDTITGGKINWFYTEDAGDGDYKDLKTNTNVIAARSLDKNSENMLKAILDFKRVEFYWEGIRWFDVVRHKIEVSHFIQSSLIGTSLTQIGARYILGANDPRRVFQIPESAQLAGLPLNPR